jgi:Spy/CpxP family protein refolding chaperone
LLSHFKDELHMNSNRFAKSLALLAGFLFLFAVPELRRAYGAPAREVQTPTPAVPGSQAGSSSSPAEYFQGLDYTPEQKAQIDKIHRDAEMKRAAVVKDDKLNQDQKDAMLAGFTHLEYGSIFKVLTPDQQKQVREKIRARKAADQAAQKRQAPQS